MFNGRKPEYDDLVIKNSGFWPDVNVENFQKQRAIPLQIPVEMVKASLIHAMQSVNIDLYELEQRLSKTIRNISELNEPSINGEKYSETLYKKAVFARAKAELLPEFNTVSAREVHENRKYVDEQHSLQAESVQAIRTLKGKKRGSVCLI